MTSVCSRFKRRIELLFDLRARQAAVGVAHREIELGGEDVAVARPALERVAEERLGGAAAVDVGGVDEVDALRRTPRRGRRARRPPRRRRHRSATTPARFPKPRDRCRQACGISSGSPPRFRLNRRVGLSVPRGWRAKKIPGEAGASPGKFLRCCYCSEFALSRARRRSAAAAAEAEAAAADTYPSPGSPSHPGRSASQAPQAAAAAAAAEAAAAAAAERSCRSSSAAGCET